MAYVAGAVDPVNRLRTEIGDTGTSPDFADAELQRWLDASISDERILVYLPTSTDGATGATVGVAMSTDTPPLLELTLTRTIAAVDSSDVLELAAATDLSRVEDLVDAIGALDKGWRVGFRRGRDAEIINPTSSSWIGQLITVGSIAQYAPSINLALTATARDAYGSQSDAAELRFYKFWAAVVRALEAMDREGSTASDRREGNVRLSFDVAGRLAYARRRAVEGIYAV